MPTPRHKKYALLFGLNYKNTQSELYGCINDVVNIKNMLINKLQYDSKNITLLTDNTPIVPTKANMIRAFNNALSLINNNKCDELWLHYSGHGFWGFDTNGDERDGRDEFICPLDMDTQGAISDDYLQTSFLQKITNPNVKITAIFDACNSGTQMDLPYKYTQKRKEAATNTPRIGVGQIVVLSGCKDDQTSSDVYDNRTNRWGGAMTNCFLNVLKNNNYVINFFNMIDKMHWFLKKKGELQMPQLTTNFSLSSNMYFLNKKGQNPVLLKKEKNNIEKELNRMFSFIRYLIQLYHKYKNNQTFVRKIIAKYREIIKLVKNRQTRLQQINQRINQSINHNTHPTFLLI